MAQHNLSSPPGHIDSMSVSPQGPLSQSPHLTHMSPQGSYVMGPYHSSMQPRGPQGQCYLGNSRVYYQQQQHNPAMGGPQQTRVPHLQEMGSPPPRILTSPPIAVRPMMQQQHQIPMQTSGHQVVFQQTSGQPGTYVATPTGPQQIVTMHGQTMRVMQTSSGQFQLPPGAIVIPQRPQIQQQMNPGYQQQQTLIMQQQPQMSGQPRLMHIQQPSTQQPVQVQQRVMVSHPNTQQQQGGITYVQQQQPPVVSQQQQSAPQSQAPVQRPPAPVVQAQAQSAPTTSYEPPNDSARLLEKRRLEDLVKEVDPCEQLDEDVKDALLQLTDDFVDRLIADSCKLAKHRKSSSLDVKDVKLSLEKNWNIYIPGFGDDEIKPVKKACATEAHKQRMILIKKSLKKS